MTQTLRKILYVEDEDDIPDFPPLTIVTPQINLGQVPTCSSTCPYHVLIVDDDPFHRSLERVSGTLKYLTGNVYMVTSNLTDQVCHTQSLPIAALRV